MIVPVLSWLNLQIFYEPVCFSTVELHHSVTVYVSNFPLLLGTTVLHLLLQSVAPGFAYLRWLPNIGPP